MGEGQQQESSWAHQACCAALHFPKATSAMQQSMQSLQEQMRDAEIPNSIQLN